jgi:alpha-beta hydrolase superfamily lysophospholipase
MMNKRDEGRRRPDILQKFTSAIYNRKFKHEGEQAWTCSDADVRRQFAENPRCNFTITVDLAKTLMDLMKDSYSRKGWEVKNPELPIIFISGADDPCMISIRKFEKATKMIGDCGYINVKNITYPQMRHEVLNEIDKQRAWDDILDFINGVAKSY